MINDDSDEENDVDLECIEHESPSRRMLAFKYSPKFSSSKEYLSNVYLGYINDHYDFISPKVELEDTENGIAIKNIMYINLHRPKDIEKANKKIAIDIIIDIVCNEVQKYEECSQMSHIVKMVLNYGSLMSKC